MIDAPCKGCEDRKIGCHSKCEKYAAYLERRKAVKMKAAGLSIFNEYSCEKAQRFHKMQKKMKGE